MVSGKARAGLILCAVPFAIAAFDLVLAVANPPGGDMIPGATAVLFLPLTLVGVVSAIWAWREIDASNGAIEGRTSVLAAIVMAAVTIAGVLAFGPVTASRRGRYGQLLAATSAVGCIRAINSAEHAYASAHPDIGFTCELRDLALSDRDSAGMNTRELADGRLGGYIFQLSACSGRPNKRYWITAEPEHRGKLKARAFCSDESWVVRYAADGSADSCAKSGEPLQ